MINLLTTGFIFLISLTEKCVNKRYQDRHQEVKTILSQTKVAGERLVVIAQSP